MTFTTKILLRVLICVGSITLSHQQQFAPNAGNSPSSPRFLLPASSQIGQYPHQQPFQQQARKIPQKTQENEGHKRRTQARLIPAPLAPLVSFPAVASSEPVSSQSTSRTIQLSSNAPIQPKPVEERENEEETATASNQFNTNFNAPKTFRPPSFPQQQFQPKPFRPQQQPFPQSNNDLEQDENEEEQEVDIATSKPQQILPTVSSTPDSQRQYRKPPTTRSQLNFRPQPVQQDFFDKPARTQFEKPARAKSDIPEKRAKKPVAQILRRYREDNPDGSITWGFENDDGSYKEETIGNDCVTKGKYGYIDPDGVKREYTYVSGLPCDKNKDAENEQEAENSPAGYVDYSSNRVVLPNGQSVDLNMMVKNRARKPVSKFRN